MKYEVNHIPIDPKKRPGTKIKHTSYTIHSTANPKSKALNERNWLVNKTNTRSASWHIAVDDKMAVEAIPLNEIAYHSGTSNGNNTSIGIEMCESGNRAKTIDNTIKLVARLLHQDGWGTDRLKRHFDWSGKNCPGILSANNWEGWRAFIIQVDRELIKLSKEDKLDLIKINLHGQDLEVEGIRTDNTNYVPIRFIEQLGYSVTWKDGKVHINYRKD